MTGRPKDFGAFITPFHPVGQSSTTAMEYDQLFGRVGEAVGNAIAEHTKDASVR